MAEGTLVKVLLTPSTYRKLRTLQQALGADTIAETVDILYKLLLEGRIKSGPSRSSVPKEPGPREDLST